MPVKILRHITFIINDNQFSAVSTKQCEPITSMNYRPCLLAAHSGKSSVYKIIQGGITKSAL